MGSDCIGSRSLLIFLLCDIRFWALDMFLICSSFMVKVNQVFIDDSNLY